MKKITGQHVLAWLEKDVPDKHANADYKLGWLAATLASVLTSSSETTRMRGIVGRLADKEGREAK